MLPALRAILFGTGNPIMDLNFAGGIYQVGGATYSSVADIPGWSFARASVGRSLNGELDFGSGVARIVPGSGLLIEETRTNLFLNSGAPVTQDVTITATSHTITVWGFGSVTVSAGTATISNGGDASSGSPRTIGCTVGGTITVTVTGSPTYVQVEAGVFGTSPIVTTGSTAARATDNARVTGLVLASAGTLLVDATAVNATSVSGVGGLNPTATCLTNTNDAVIIGRNPGTNAANLTVRAGGGVVAAVGANAWANGTTGRAAARYGLDNFALSFNGLAPETDTAGAAPTLDRLHIGQARTAGNGLWNGYVRRVIVPSTVYSNAQLQAWAA